MSEVICNTSPLQYLHQLGRLKLLPAFFSRVFVPPSVVFELERGYASGIHLPEIQRLPWLSTLTPATVPLQPGTAFRLGAGELEVLALGLENRNAMVILDDARARRRAAELGLRLTGTLGLLVDAKARGLIPALKPEFERLRQIGFRLSPRIAARLLAMAGEE